jgi:hypothetical protein
MHDFTEEHALRPHVRPALVITWLRCYGCQRGYFTASSPGPQPCPACSGERLQLVALWNLRTELAPPGMLIAREVRP